jgi:hypothetical protein
MAQEKSSGVHAPVTGGVTRPFGQTNIDEWLHWAINPAIPQAVCVRWRGTWYVVGKGLWGYTVSVVSGKGKKFDALPTIKYQDIPANIQADLNEWRWKLRDALAGLEVVKYEATKAKKDTA